MWRNVWCSLKVERDFLGAGFPWPRGKWFRAGSFWTGAPERALGFLRFCTLWRRGKGGWREEGKEGGEGKEDIAHETKTTSCVPTDGNTLHE